MTFPTNIMIKSMLRTKRQKNELVLAWMLLSDGWVWIVSLVCKQRYDRTSEFHEYLIFMSKQHFYNNTFRSRKNENHTERILYSGNLHFFCGGALPNPVHKTVRPPEIGPNHAIARPRIISEMYSPSRGPTKYRNRLSGIFYVFFFVIST